MQFVNCYLIEKQQRILNEGHKVLENAAIVILASMGWRDMGWNLIILYSSFEDF